MVSLRLPNVADHLYMDILKSLQVLRSPFHPEYEEIIYRAEAKGAGVLVRRGLAQGSVAIAPEVAMSHRQNAVGMHSDLRDRASLDEHVGKTVRTAFLRRSTLRHSNVTSVIVGTTTLSVRRQR